MQTLRSKKIRATKEEYSRVYDNFNMPPQNIYVEHDGQTYMRKAWQGLNRFGWGKWILC